MITQAFFDCQNFHILLSSFFITILLFLVLFFDYCIYLQLATTVLTLITYGILGKIVFDTVKYKTKNKFIVHKFQQEKPKETQQQWVSQFQSTCRKIIMQKRLKQIQQDPYAYERYRSNQTFSIQEFKQDYKYNRQDPKPVTSILASTEIIVGNSKKIVLENFELISTNAEISIEDRIFKKLGLQLNKKKQAINLIKKFFSAQLQNALAKIEQNIYKVNEILSSNFGKKLTHNFYPAQNQITITQLEQLLAIYKNCKTLPTEYIQTIRNSDNLDYLMQDISNKMQILQIVNGYPSKNVPLNMTIFILQTVFKREKIIIQGSKRKREDLLRRSKDHIISVHMNQKLCLQSCPQLKTDKCIIFSLLFSLNLLKNQYSIDYSILRSLKKFCQ